LKEVEKQKQKEMDKIEEERVRKELEQINVQLQKYFLLLR